jgi:hypothetical protein
MYKIVLAIYLFLTFISFNSFAADITQKFNPCNGTKYSYFGEDPQFSNTLTPGIPWPVWADLLNVHWSENEIKRGYLFDQESIKHTIKSVVKGNNAPPDYTGELNKYEYYKPSTSSTSEQIAAYESAAALYRSGQWAEAISQLNVIAADVGSPYRAAAAYTAARASINLGKYEDSVKRIFDLTTNPALNEFHLAAYHLIGTLAYQSAAPELIAARYAEIAHLLQAPASVVCRDAVAQNLLKEAKEDLFTFYLQTAFPNDRMRVNHRRRDVLDAIASGDAFFDLIRAIAAPTPYASDRGWLAVETSHDPKASGYGDETAIALALRDSKAITEHARQKWQETKNLLWGYALAQRTSDIADFPLMKEMLAQLLSQPNTPSVQYSIQAFRRHFIRHSVRILLTNGRIDDAIELLRKNWVASQSDSYPTSMCDWRCYFPMINSGQSMINSGDANATLNGGIRLLIERFDLDGARKWASEASNVLKYTMVDEGLRPLLANNIDELLDNKIPGNDQNVFSLKNRAISFPKTVADLFSRQKIISLSLNPKLTKSEFRALLASGWLRTYLLDGWKASLKLLPQMRIAYPELATDIDNIDRAWLNRTKRHLLTRLILRVPAFNLRPSWVRANLPADPFSGHPDNFSYRYGPNAEDIFSIDGYNPNDANWWCPIDEIQVKSDMAEYFFVNQLNQNSILFTDDFLPRRNYFFSKETKSSYYKSMVKLADKLIAWHPLLKDADLSELDRLSKVENGPKLLSEKTISWANGSNWFTRLFNLDNDLPETLHLAVRSTRYGCRLEGGHGSYSRAAYELLYKLYPQSDWAKKTPYWFD